MILAPPCSRPTVAPAGRSLLTRVGRLQQVEYAIEAISQAGTSIGIMSTEGIVLAAEKNVLSKLLDPRQALEKIFHLSE